MIFIKLTLHDKRAVLINAETINSIFQAKPTAIEVGVNATIDAGTDASGRPQFHDVRETIEQIQEKLCVRGIQILDV